VSAATEVSVRDSVCGAAGWAEGDAETAAVALPHRRSDTRSSAERVRRKQPSGAHQPTIRSTAMRTPTHPPDAHSLPLRTCFSLRLVSQPNGRHSAQNDQLVTRNELITMTTVFQFCKHPIDP
jgi:hypothetical protein